MMSLFIRKKNKKGVYFLFIPKLKLLKISLRKTINKKIIYNVIKFEIKI